MTVGLVAATAAGRRAAERLAAAWPDAHGYDGQVGEALRRAFAECSGVVCFLAVGAAVRLLAPLLDGKHTDPGVVCVDEALRFAVPVVGAHAGGANALAERVAAVLGCAPVVTTASDAAGVTPLDTYGAEAGFRVEDDGDLAAVAAAVLSGERVTLTADATWPLPALPPNVVPAPAPEPGVPAILVTDRILGPATRPRVVYRPPSLVVGVGASRGVPAGEVLDLIETALAEAGLSLASVRHIATVEAKADETGVVDAAAALGLPLVTHPAEALAEVGVPNPSEVVRAAVGTPSVAEAAALYSGEVYAGGAGACAGERTPEGGRWARAEAAAELVVQKRASSRATVAVARHRPRGRLALVGIGPGARDLLTPRAAGELRRASVVVGLDQYVDQVRDLLRPGTHVLASGLGEEEARARTAVERAREGHAVALIGSGDAGIYAMASPALELADAGIDVVGVPGITAALAASALLGAPLGHDHAVISLSDLHTPWEAIEARVRAAAEADYVVVFYNPRSRGRDWQLERALRVLAEHRAPTTPVGVVRAASRPDERVALTTLVDVDATTVDMTTLVIVGCSRTRVVAGRMITPRGYAWRL